MKAILVIDISSHNEKNYYAEIHIKHKQSHKKVKTFPHCNLKPLPSREYIHEEIYQAYGLGKEERYERMRNAVDKVLDEILGGEE